MPKLPDGVLGEHYYVAAEGGTVVTFAVARGDSEWTYYKATVTNTKVAAGSTKLTVTVYWRSDWGELAP